MDIIKHKSGEILRIVANNPSNHWDETASKELGKSMVNTKFEYEGETYIAISSSVMRGSCGYVGDIVLRCVKI